MYYNPTSYSSTTHNYYYKGTSSPNHAVAIVGWNDSFDKNNFSQVPPEESKPAKPAGKPSPDGRTRLTVTSYIGIGNKLHLRGEGAGLSWSKGAPLQFVSIGRWRWETDKATGPVTCRIYKNDRLEAPTGLLTLLPGTEQEVSATF